MWQPKRIITVIFIVLGNVFVVWDIVWLISSLWGLTWAMF